MADLDRAKFIHAIAHQLRAPLASIRWNLETLMSEEEVNAEEWRTLVKSAHDADVEAIRCINDMLAAADIDAGHAVLKRENAALSEIEGPVLEEMRRRCEAKGITFRYEGPKTSLPMVQVDGEKIRTVFRHLVENAADYTPPNGTVTVKVDRHGDHVRFEVTDTGIGIPDAEQAEVYQRFYRAKNATSLKADSGGIGLYIAKSYVEMHGGRIGFESKEGKGTTFWFDLPL